MAHILLGDIEFDVIEEESIDFIGTPTERPVESGADVVDHIHVKPISLTIPGVIGDDNPALARQKYETLKGYRDDRELLTYVSEYEVLENVVIERFAPRRNVTTGRGFAFSLSLKQIRVAVREHTDYLPPDTISEVKPEENLGRIQPETVDVSEELGQGMMSHLKGAVSLE